jgi:uncharacterized protein (DUF1810 family)
MQEKKYGEVIFQTAEKLLIHSQANSIKEYQIRALFEMKKYSEVAFVGRSLLECGGTTPDILAILLHSLVELGEEQRFLKTLNLIYNLNNADERKWRDVSHIDRNDEPLDL